MAPRIANQRKNKQCHRSNHANRNHRANERIALKVGAWAPCRRSLMKTVFALFDQGIDVWNVHTEHGLVSALPNTATLLGIDLRLAKVEGGFACNLNRSPSHRLINDIKRNALAANAYVNKSLSDANDLPVEQVFANDPPIINVRAALRGIFNDKALLVENSSVHRLDAVVIANKEAVLR